MQWPQRLGSPAKHQRSKAWEMISVLWKGICRYLMLSRLWLTLSPGLWPIRVKRGLRANSHGRKMQEGWITGVQDKRGPCHDEASTHRLQLRKTKRTPGHRQTDHTKAYKSLYSPKRGQANQVWGIRNTPKTSRPLALANPEALTPPSMDHWTFTFFDLTWTYTLDQLGWWTAVTALPLLSMSTPKRFFAYESAYQGLPHTAHSRWTSISIGVWPAVRARKVSRPYPLCTQHKSPQLQASRFSDSAAWYLSSFELMASTVRRRLLDTSAAPSGLNTWPVPVWIRLDQVGSGCTKQLEGFA